MANDKKRANPSAQSTHSNEETAREIAEAEKSPGLLERAQFCGYVLYIAASDSYLSEQIEKGVAVGAKLVNAPQYAIRYPSRLYAQRGAEEAEHAVAVGLLFQSGTEYQVVFEQALH